MLRKHFFLICLSLMLVFFLVTYDMPLTFALPDTSIFEVAASADDCVYRAGDGFWSKTKTYFQVGGSGLYPISHGWGSAARFQNINIPKDATVQEAFLNGCALNNRSLSPVNSYIKAQDADDPGAFTTKTEFLSRTWMDAYKVAWDSIEDFTQDEWYNSTDISIVIEAVLNRSGWASGNDLVIVWEDWDYRTMNADGMYLRDLDSYDAPGSDLLQLHVTWIYLIRTITFKQNAGGLFRADCTTKTNGTSTNYWNATVLELAALTQNATYVFLNFTWSNGNSTVNPFNYTVLSNMTIWLYFDTAGPPGMFSQGFIIGAIICVVVGLIFAVALSKRQ